MYVYVGEPLSIHGIIFLTRGMNTCAFSFSMGFFKLRTKSSYCVNIGGKIANMVFDGR